LPQRVFITRLLPDPGLSVVAAAADEVDHHALDEALPADEIRRRVVGASAMICMLTDAIDATILEAAAQGGCGLVANVAAGYNNIDVAAATRLGILVTNTPGVLTEATADLAFALILAVARRVVEGDRVMRRGAFTGWSPFYMLGTEVSGSTLGLIGPGRIAEAVARRARGFGMALIHHGRRPAPALEALGSRPVALNDLLETADFVSLHTPLTPDTHHLINASALARMKPTAILINTARGPVVDEAALVEALRRGQIAGAGLDVYEREPLMAEGLAECPNTVLLPHLGSATRTTRGAMAATAAANVAAWLRGERPPHLVNPEVWEARAVKGTADVGRSGTHGNT
jgi:glyoxylate reductase